MIISKEETQILNGNMSEVFREGNIVYRKMKTQSKTIHKLLLHLEKKNIDFTPNLIGVDIEKNLEKLTFVQGETIDNYPMKNDKNYKIEVIQLVAKMLREYHDATLDFERSTEDTWFLEYEGELEAEVICHNDFAPYNITFKEGKPSGIIDFDTACPAPRIWDMAYTAYRFIPLSMDVYLPHKKIYGKYDKTLDSLERKELLKEFIKAYGFGNTSDVMENVVLRLQSLVKLFDTECQRGNYSFIKMKEEGHQSFYIKEIEFIKNNMHDWI
ncbi:MAG: phosphotransferase [Clostridium sp.]